MASRFFALVVWAAVAASVAYWGLRWLSKPAAVPAYATPVTLDAAVRGDLQRLLAPPPEASSGPAAMPSEAQALAGRLKLMGVVAPRDEGGPGGIALLLLDGKPARAVRVGMVIDGTYVLRTLSQRSAGIGPTDGPVSVNLDLPLMPPPATGIQPEPKGVLKSDTMPSVAAMQGNAQLGTAVAAAVPPTTAPQRVVHSPFHPDVTNPRPGQPPRSGEAAGTPRQRRLPTNAMPQNPGGMPPPPGGATPNPADN